MCSNSIPSSRLGLTLVEVLGATAVIVTLATVSVVSIRDSVQAGQKAVMQREVQLLNVALEEYKSAGGVIADDASVTDALSLLEEGVDLAGDGNKDYAPLVNTPPLQMTVAGEAYDLTFTPQEGFAYTNAAGEGVGFSGAALQPVEPVITNGSLPSVLSYMSTLAPNSPAYADSQSQLAIAMASDLLSPESKQSINDAMLTDGYVYNPETLSWEGVTGVQTPLTVTEGALPQNDQNQNYSFDITDPAAVQGAMDALPALRSWNDQDPDMDPRDYSQTIAGLLEASQQGHSNYTPEGVRSFVDAELTGMMAAIDEARRTGQPQQWASLINSMVKVLEVDDYYNGWVADFIVGQRMGRMDHNGIPEAFKVDSVDWTVQTPNQAPVALYQPTGANANITPVLGRVFKLDSGDTLSALFGTPETAGIIGGDTAHTAQRAVTMINGSAYTYYWNTNLDRWSRVALGTPDVTNYFIPAGSLVFLKPAL